MPPLQCFLGASTQTRKHDSVCRVKPISTKHKVHISLTQLTDKFVFVDVRLKNAVIASQCAHWRGNPPVREKCTEKHTKNGNSCDFCW